MLASPRAENRHVVHVALALSTRCYLSYQEAKSQQTHDIPRPSSFVKQKHAIQLGTTMLTTCYERQAANYVQRTLRNIRPQV